ncbi:MAG: hypothetical protein COY80_01890 [Candidatus Pacebacteria bacterium CG_4_10_14_0_8_um_filter_42_14]|nr:MAG: hypothetical protein COY80_01890 [Candidatus Pacebacteria bacterium CG_4_10_14_0_8_um_filter_42_14]
MKKSQVTKPVSRPKTPAKKVALVGRSYHYSGPLPHPSVLNQYDPQTRKTIVGMAKNQSSHRQSIELSVIASNIKNERTGMFIAGSLTFAMIIAGVILLAIGKDFAGYASIFGPAFFQAGNYLYNRQQEKEAAKKDNE